MLDHDVHFDAQPGCVALDGHAVAPQDAADARPRRQPDDAVAGERRLADDLGDGVTRDREPPVLELQRQIRHDVR